MQNVGSLYILLIYFTRVAICLRVISIKVPEIKQRGESATLQCEYRLEGARLYSVKWYRDNEEFYRFMPRLRPPQHAHKLDGIKVDLERSSDRLVHLRDLTLRSRGNYRCEVSEEAPSFHSDQADAFLEVYYFPREGPHITGHEHPYSVGEPLNVTCTSARAFPAPELQWYIDGIKVTIRSWIPFYNVQATSQGLFISTLGLRAPATLNMQVKCIASVGSHRRERTVTIETNTSTRCKTDHCVKMLLQMNFIHMLFYTLKYKNC